MDKWCPAWRDIPRPSPNTAAMNSSKAMAMPKIFAPIGARMLTYPIPSAGESAKRRAATGMPRYNALRHPSMPVAAMRRRLYRSRPRVPMALEIGDQRWAEMAIRLLARVDRHIAAKGVERFLGDAKGPAVACGADHPGIGEAVDHPGDRRVHRIRLDDLVADKAAFGAVAVQPPPRHDRLPGDAVAGEAPQAQIRRPGYDAFLARRQRQIGVARGDDVVHDEKILAAAADREGVDRRDPRFLDGLSDRLVGRGILPRETAEDLVHHAHVALQIPDIGDLAEIEMGQVDAGGEHPAAAIFRMLDGVAAQHRDLGSGIEYSEVDRGFDRVDRRGVLGVGKARMPHLHEPGLADALHARGAKIDRAARDEFGKALGGLASRQQHGMAEVLAGGRLGQHARQEDALVDLGPFLLAERQRALLRYGFPRRSDARQVGGGVVD